MEVAFYQLMSTSLEKTLAKLLEKVYESSQKAVVLLDSQERLEHLNSYLWTYSTAAFLPHGSPQDASLIAERQPIWLTTEFENPNKAQVIVVTTGETLKFEDNSFQRGLDLFDGNDEEDLKKAQERYQFYKNNYPGHKSSVFLCPSIYNFWRSASRRQAGPQ